METWIVVGVIAFSLVVTVVAIRLVGGIGAPIKGGVPATALLRGFGETGTTISSPNTGPEAPVYLLDLLVSPMSGAPYEVRVKQPVPRIVLPFFVPGIHVPVDVDPQKPARVKVAFGRFDAVAARAAASQATAVAGTGAPGPGVTVTFSGDAPVAGVDALLGAVRSGALPTEKASARDLLAVGARGTAEITQAMPLGKLARDVFPDCPPADADDPIWVLTLKVELPGQAPFPAMVGHRVPRERVADVVPGLRVPVAVDLADRHGRVAVDWGD